MRRPAAFCTPRYQFIKFPGPISRLRTTKFRNSNKAMPMLPREKRRTRRIDLRHRGKISSLAGHSVADCVVVDISETGARLTVRIPDVIPDYFRLYYGAKGITPKCRVRWRRGKELGVEFFR
jgi:hypothetical protein